MIVFAEPLACGNAIKLTLEPALGATGLRLLRKPASAQISGPFDASAFLVDEASSAGGFGAPLACIDAAPGLANGALYCYRDYWRIGGEWVAGPDAPATPAATYAGASPDPQTILCDRIDAGLRVEVARGALTPPSNLDAIEVLRSPPLFEDARFPLVTVEFLGGRPETRFVGNRLLPDEDAGAAVRHLVGWVERTELGISAYSLNPDERLALRLALKRILMANLPVLSGLGLDQIEMPQSDEDDFSLAPPVYATRVNFSCISTVAIVSESGKISEIEASASVDL